MPLVCALGVAEMARTQSDGSDFGHLPGIRNALFTDNGRVVMQVYIIGVIRKWFPQARYTATSDNAYYVSDLRT
jgi:hypothetical protein